MNGTNPSSERRPDSPGLVEALPRFTADETTTLFRCHLQGDKPPYFNSRGTGRFHPPPGWTPVYGTCCTAHEAVIAVVEVWGDRETGAEELNAEYRVSRIWPTVRRQVADLTAPKAVELLGEELCLRIQTSPHRPVTQPWGAAMNLYFDGVRHTSRWAEDPTARCIAFFGEPGEDLAAMGVGPPEQLGDLIVQAERYGLRTFPEAPRGYPEQTLY
ncbi:hypothetical protein [Streptomyces sp. NRRL S-350]|uniref:hypothetical protein n=1 Tax=Streptomyces sp. NRRL S-350 TaxID=1463902 RepID=UPI00131B4F62|nr:hypothetical protein [Streptomyces sp. NRRL S-350]